MPDPLGISFSPFDPANTGGPGGAPTGAYGGGRSGVASSPQDAIRVLSLRLPRVVGAGAPAPASLLAGPGGSAPGGASFGPAGSNLEQLLALLFGQHRLFGGGGPESFMPGQMGGGMGVPWGGPASAGIFGGMGAPGEGRGPGASYPGRAPMPGFIFQDHGQPGPGDGSAHVPLPPAYGPGSGGPAGPPSAGPYVPTGGTGGPGPFTLPWERPQV